MKIAETAVTEAGTRRIASQEHNLYLAQGIQPHTATQIVPSGLLQPFSEALEAQLLARHKAVEKALHQYLGKPFYSEPGFILYQGDSTELLSHLGKAEVSTEIGTEVSVDLTVTSPPYNIGKAYEQPMSVEEYVAWCSGWMAQVYQVTKPNGAFWLNVGYLEVPGQGLCVPISYLLWNQSPFYLLQEVVWKYGAGVSAKRRLSPRNEKWLFYTKNPKSYTFNLDDIRDPNVKYPNQKKQGRYRCNPLGKNPSDVWEFPKITTGENRSSKERTNHPAQFPLAIVERIVRASSNPVEIVLDPFAGSCSAGIAAAGLGRIFIGFELKSNYCEMAANRFEQFQQARRTATQQG
ncbi:site-specific DNA-methyltransferase [Leptolyngbya sp. FACHB-261]|uniref:DNA-methyltransferase n=1 Tax=Leptolyngbya sp. FACHB-261 TaxID=2692806 RepID=UPI00168463E4|nr:site-specific DNA-methyltransferase [Leptolyngbya sp. FACHB-261]MBD2099725.1 site-specific DNA-methyltransferase [Leptolyngbya sp. FACHB-261]